MRQCLLIVLLLGCAPALLWAQAIPDSATARLDQAEGAERVVVLTEILKDFHQSHPAEALAYGNEALALLSAYPDAERDMRYFKGLAHYYADQLDSVRVQADALHEQGSEHMNASEYDAARPFFTAALELREALEDLDGQANTLKGLALSYVFQGAYDEALARFIRILRLREELGDPEAIAAALNSMGNIYDDVRDPEEALVYHRRALAIREELGDREGIAASLNNIGVIYQNMGDLEEALSYHTRALPIREEADDQIGIATTLNNLGDIQSELGNQDEALSYLTRALEINKKVGERRDIVESYLVIGAIYLKQGTYDEALAVTDKALAIADSIGAWPLLSNLYEQRADIFEAQGRFEEALVAHRAFKAANDSVFSTESQGVVEELQAQYRTKEQQQQIELLESRRAQQRLWLTLLLGGLALLVVIIVLMVGRMRLRRRALAAIEKAQQETEEKAAELERANDLKSRFLANISHEFRTPLTLTFGPLDDAIEGRYASFDEARPHFERARRNGGRLLRLINQLLDLSKLDAGALLLQARPHDLVTHLRQLASLFDSIAEARGIHYTTHLPEEPLLHIYDADKIEKVVINLLSNAFKFTEPGGKISFGIVEEADGTVEIEVADTGPGIAEEHLPHLFDRFYQVESTATRTHEGTGIGLALVKELVELHEGTLRVESKVGFGTRFMVRLPVLESSTTTLEPEGDGPHAIIKAPGEEVTQEIAGSLASLAGAKSGTVKEAASETEEVETETVVLVVEDNADMRAYIRSHLEDLVTVVEAENGRAGIERAVEVVPDLILSDVMMPEMDGLDLCQAVKADDRTSHIPVVLLTARAQVEHRIAGYNSGADAYLPKPFNAEELRVRVQTLIAERRRLWARLAGRALPQPPSADLAEEPAAPSLPPREAAFLEGVETVVLDRLGDTTFSVDELADVMALSPRQLLRKLRALTGETTASMIRRIRLEQAAALLITNDVTIKEVAFGVGFNNESSFSRAFSQQYGVAPSVYAEQHQQV